MSPIALLSIMLTVQSAPTVGTDTRLVAPVTLSHKYLPVKQFATLIKDKTGVEILVQAKLQERKMAVFCIDRPLNEVMDRAADAMLLKWEPVGERYRLVEPAEVAAADERVRQAEAKARQQGLRDYCSELARIARMTPAAVKEEIAVREKKKIPASLEADANHRILSLLKETTVQESRSASGEVAAGHVLSQLGAAEVKQLFAGQTIFALSPAVPGLPSLPPNMVLQSFDQNAPPHTSGALILRMRSNGIQFQRQSLGRKDGGEASGGVTGSDWAGGSVFQYKNERDIAWEGERAADVLSTELTGEPGDLPSDPPKNKTLTMADQLEELHRRTKLPIVAEAFRIPETYWRWTEGATVKEWIENRYNEGVYFTSRGYHMRASDGWLMGRKEQRWTYIPREPAEDVVLAANAEVKPSGMLSTEGYSKFASGLTDEQVEAFRNTTEYNVRFLLAPLRDGMTGFRLIGSLNEADRKRLFAGQMLPVRGLPAKAQARYREALAESVWHGIVKDEVYAALLPTAPPLPPTMSLWLLSAADSFWSTAYMPEDLQEPKQQPNFNSTPVDFQRLQLGVSKELAASIGLISDDTRKKQ